MFDRLSRAHRLMIIIAISSSFFIAEISVGFYTHSLALVADAFHYLNDLIGFVVALCALRISQTQNPPKHLSFGWQRAQLLGAFFNGVFLFALGVSIFLQSIERFVSLQRVQHPKLVLVVGCTGFTLNVISAVFIHEHNHSTHTSASQEQGDGANAMESIKPHLGHRHKVDPKISKGYNLNMLGVFLHVLGDAANNVGVIIAAAVIWKADYGGRYYADPGVSMGIALLILSTSFPLVKKSGSILLETVPDGIDLDDVQHDLENVKGVVSVHELHVWRLNQDKTLASAHVRVSDDSMQSFMALGKTATECFHAYGIHSVTLQPELARRPMVVEVNEAQDAHSRDTSKDGASSVACQISCGPSCDDLTCCNAVSE